jgi:UDP-GlcNAc:undecaprenyl-phosphate GlcNAc-1-phosphate transferase
MSDLNLGIYLIIAMMAMAISMAIIPLMMRLAPAMGMIDAPDARKVHTVAIPRVGGLGIVIGAIIPMLIWLPFNDLTISIFLGAGILLIFGTWDDITELGHYVKFTGQFLAAGIVVYYGDLYVSFFPFNNYETIPEAIGRPFTVVAIVGMINAINHSDGLDGLAGGESLISLAVISYLSFSFESALMLVIASATIGGIFGFLRFNSHPARVFMGDGGSQFLGFILAVLVLILTQDVQTTVSPAIPLLLLGLPIVDIIAVFFLRAKHKLNLFKATRNHVHHRLLDIGFLHYESVIFIYTFQFILVVSAIPLLYESDFSVVAVYLLICTSVFLFLTVSERNNFKIHAVNAVKKDFLASLFDKFPHMKDVPVKLVEVGLSLFIIASPLIVNEVPADFALSSLFLFVLMVLVLITGFMGFQLYRLILFVTIGFSVYLLTTFPVSWLSVQFDLVFIYFICMSIIGFIAIKLTASDEFKITPLDYLVIAMAFIIELMPGENASSEIMVWMVVQIIVLFYLCEIVVQNMKSRFNRFTGSIMLALALVSYRGLA